MKKEIVNFQKNKEGYMEKFEKKKGKWRKDLVIS